MKLITAVIRPEHLETTRRALAAFGAPGMTVTPLLSGSRWNRHLEVYRAEVLVADLVPRLRIDVLANDEDVPDLVGLLARIGRPPHGGDDTGRVWISAVEQVVRVRTGEHGEPAI
ncbi:P-II family nitrogen regulator [Actinocrinis sp.]|uniref:P-II family nitrogen regulator n=1 Tax=Actinocrinis sp. TaxID=1920516 RepID=UPI002D567B8B|nr:P-II family nitrogen regulator [Actinocrinis sp.]HZP54526.1 P-II family nitrogen regulator [Actinocrinis sp.]